MLKLIRNAFLFVCLSNFVLPSEADASKAKAASMQGARFLKTSQTIFTNPAHLATLGNFLTIEFGDSNNSASPKAEGGAFVQKLGGVLGVYLGHLEVQQKRFRDLESYYIEQNPVELFYSVGKFGVSAFYSKDVQNNVAFDQGQKTFGSRLGFSGEKLDAYLTVNWIGKAQKSQTDKLKTRLPALQGGIEFNFGNYYSFAEASWLKGNLNITTPTARVGANSEIYSGEIGVQDRTYRNEEREIYYGISVKYDRVKKHIFSTTNMTLPLVIGLEQKINDWLNLRASLSQNFILGYTRDQTQNPPANRRDSVRNNTTAAGGASFFYKGFELAGVLSAATTGDLNASSILANASATYAF